jgi:hypothetical protein
MRLPNWFRKAATYVMARFQEPSFYRGLIPMISAGSWASLDGSNKGELIAAAGLFLAGFVQAVLPQDFLYKQDKPK